MAHEFRVIFDDPETGRMTVIVDAASKHEARGLIQAQYPLARCVHVVLVPG